MTVSHDQLPGVFVIVLSWLQFITMIGILTFWYNTDNVPFASGTILLLAAAVLWTIYRVSARYPIARSQLTDPFRRCFLKLTFPISAASPRYQVRFLSLAI